MEPLPDYGNLFTLEDFTQSCKDGSFMDYDGSGYYATATKMSEIDASPSDIKAGHILKSTQIDGAEITFTHVMWFNK